MSQDEVKTKRIGISIGVNTVITTIGLGLLSLLGYSMNQQLETISLKQDKAILQVQKDNQETFVSKQWFLQEDAALHATDARTTDSIEKISDVLNDLRVGQETIRVELAKQNNHSDQNK